MKKLTAILVMTVLAGSAFLALPALYPIKVSKISINEELTWEHIKGDFQWVSMQPNPLAAMVDLAYQHHPFLSTVTSSYVTDAIVLNVKGGHSFLLDSNMIVKTAHARSHTVETMFLTDEPGNWFKSATGGLLGVGGTPLTIVDSGGTVEFDFKNQTDATHTVTILMKPEGSTVVTDLDKADDGKISVTFDLPGVYLFVCKVHPYMIGLVAVPTDPNNPVGSIPDIVGVDTAAVPGETILPALGPGGALATGPLAATTVVTALTPVAPLDGGAGDLFSALFGKKDKWDIVKSDGTQFVANEPTLGNLKTTFTLSAPDTPGIGEVWVNSQFEKVTGQTTDTGLKPGTITVHDASDLDGIIQRISSGGSTTITGPIDVTDAVDPDVEGEWNNPHNMWTNVKNDVIYNGNWFGQWLQSIDRMSGDIESSIDVGPAPTHIVTIPKIGPDFDKLTLPLSGAEEILKIEVRKSGRLHIDDHFDTGFANNHPHGQWITSDGERIVIPNVFQGFGTGGSVSVMDAATGDILDEVRASEEPNLQLPVAVGIKGSEKAYISNIGTGTVTVLDVDPAGGFSGVLKNIPVTIPGGLLTSLQLPIQTPVSPDGRHVVTAVFSLASQLVPDKIKVIDTETDTVVATLECPPGCHGANWGPKYGGGYYAYVTSQHSNILTVVDPDPGVDSNGNGTVESDGSDAAIVAQVRVGNPTDTELAASPTIGVGGQGILAIPLVSNGWIQNTVAACGVNPSPCSAEINGFLAALTASQKAP